MDTANAATDATDAPTEAIRPFRIDLPQTDLDDLDLLVGDMRSFFRELR